MMTRVNNTALINGTALVSLALLSNPRGAIAEDDLIGMIDKMIALHHVKPYDDDVVLIESNPKAVVNQVEKALGLKRLRNPSGDIIHVDEYQSVLLTYYRNNILHLYGLPSLIAACFQHRDDISESEIVTMCQQFYPFLREDLFLKWDEASIAMVTGEYISAMKQLGLLRLDPLTNHLCRPDVDSGEFTYLNLFARMISGFIERIAIASVLLDLTGRSGGVDKKNFEKKWGDMAHRLALLNGGESLSGNNSAQIHSFLDILQKRAFLFTDDIGNLQISQSMEDLIESANAVLSPDIRQSLARFVGIRN
jgi:glycerol-3-phosphate O-acyltransferase